MSPVSCSMMGFLVHFSHPVVTLLVVYSAIIFFRGVTPILVFLECRVGGQVCVSFANRTIRASARGCQYSEQATNALEFLPCLAVQISSSNSPSNRLHPFFPSHAQFTKNGECCVIRLLADTHFTIGRSQIRHTPFPLPLLSHSSLIVGLHLPQELQLTGFDLCKSRNLVL